MRLPRRPTGAPPGLGGSLASGLSARAASTLLAALLATGTPRPWLPPSPAAAVAALPSTMSLVASLSQACHAATCMNILRAQPLWHLVL